MLRAIARRAGVRLGPRAAERLAAFAKRATSGRRLDLGGGLVAEAAFELLTVAENSEPPACAHITTSEGRCDFGRLYLAWRRESAPAEIPRAGWTTWVAAGESALTVRGPAPGDRVRPVGGVGHRPVRRLLMEARVGRRERARYPLITRGGEIVWVPGICRSDVALPAPGTPALRVDAGAA